MNDTLLVRDGDLINWGFSTSFGDGIGENMPRSANGIVDRIIKEREQIYCKNNSYLHPSGIRQFVGINISAISDTHTLKILVKRPEGE